MTGPPEELTSGEHRFNYDSIAADYAAMVDQAPYNALYERPAMLAMLPDIAGLHILDAGCGSGWYAEQLVERDAIVEAIDASAAMVDHARSRIEKNVSDKMSNVAFRVADLADPLPFENDSFDGIVSPLVLHYMKDWRPALREMNRVLKPNGWLLFSTHHPAADAARLGTHNYFETEHVVDHWDWVGRVEFFRRSLTEIVNSLIDSGFVIKKLVEPRPTDAFRKAKPEAWERLMSQPEFLIILAVPNS
jgi:SAM-dependent methyltransferase